MIEVCISRHCKRMGSIDLIDEIKSYLSKNNIKEKVEVKPVFCLDCCGEPVAMKINGKVVSGITKENLGKILDEYLKKG